MVALAEVQSQVMLLFPPCEESVLLHESAPNIQSVFPSVVAICCKASTAHQTHQSTTYLDYNYICMSHEGTFMTGQSWSCSGKEEERRYEEYYYCCTE